MLVAFADKGVLLLPGHEVGIHKRVRTMFKLLPQAFSQLALVKREMGERVFG